MTKRYSTIRPTMHLTETLPLIALVLTSACGVADRSALQSDGHSSTAATLRPVAEYEPSTGVLFATGIHKAIPKDTRLDAAAIEADLKRAAEYEAMYTTIMRSQPELRYFIHTDASRDGGLEHSEYDLWLPKAEEWLCEGLRVELFKLDPADYPSGTSTYRLNEDEWARDYGATTVHDGDNTRLVSLGERGKLVNDYLGDQLGQSVRHVDNMMLEGGNFMATDDGICATTLDDRSVTPQEWAKRYKKNFADNLGCRQLLAVQPLPNEGTRHIDLFAKFMPENKVALADYKSNDVDLSTSYVSASLRCTTEQVTGESWSDCEIQSREVLSLPASSAPTTITSTEQVVELSRRLFPDAVAEEPYEHGDLVGHTAETKQAFLEMGFDAVSIPAPTPTVQLFLVRYQDPNGRVVREELAFEFTHRSFVNSLILNNHVYVPTYSQTSTMNAKAVEIYESLGLRAHAIDMTTTILAGGAVHCLSKELH